MKTAELMESFTKLSRQYEVIRRIPNEQERTGKLRTFNRLLLQVKKELATKKDKKDLGTVLRWEFERNRLKPMTDDWHLLNEIEQNEVQDKCEYFKKISASRYDHFQVGNEYKYKKHYDPNRGMYVMEVFGVMVRSSEERITPQVRQKMKLGLNVTQEEFLPPLDLHDRVILKESEWDKHFKHVNELDITDIDLNYDGSLGDELAV